MRPDPDALLAGVRGRRMLIEYARASAWASSDDASREAVSALMWASHAFEPGGTAIVAVSTGGGPVEIPEVGPADAAALLQALPLVLPDVASLRTALSAAADSAMSWQEPDGTDLLAATPEFAPVLERLATHIAASPHARWWASDADTRDQWIVPWETSSGATRDAREVLAGWREHVVAEEERAVRERPADPHARWSGEWWSMPPSGLVRSSRRLGSAGPGGLWFVEDGLGWTEATATPMAPTAARVLEIRGAADWVELCRQHPLVVTASKRHDWLRTTGRDGGWVQPDWEAVARAYDAVHLTVAGYLEAAGRALEVSGGWASVIAGWAPDETFWFAPVVLEPARAEEWRRDDDGGWRSV